MKYYSLCLPIFKQGDDFDLQYKLKQSNKAALLDLANLYEDSSRICKKVAETLADEPDLIMEGNNHEIFLDWPKDNKTLSSKIEKLVESGEVYWCDVLDEEEFTEKE